MVGSERERFNNAVFFLSSLVCGFLVIPIHELGHVVFHWATGNPAGMSYARDYLLNQGEYTLLGVSGGILFPLAISVVLEAIVVIQQSYHEAVAPFVILGSSERAIQYLFGKTPSDERFIAEALQIDVEALKTILIAVSLIVCGLLVWALLHRGLTWKKVVAMLLVTAISYVVMASIGIFVVERFLFPDQYRLQFGS